MDADKFRVFLDRQYHNCHGYIGNKKEIYREALLAVKSYVHSEGQIDAEPVRHGHWTDDDNCSMCGFHITQKTKHYCPNCGAKNDG